ncbi:hypothetical protein MMC24_000022 [Lignoscripta atroalba]|nr:hypothetical protein [Lignoscripta atroalba]
MAVPSNHCAALQSPSYLNFTLSITSSPRFILLGILISYLPQHHRIISRRSSEGISPYFVLLGTTSGTCAFANILLLGTSRADIACCREISGFECFAGLLGILQVGVQWSCFTVILLLFLLFFPRATPLAPPKSPTSTPSYKTALLVTFLCVAHAFITILLSAIFLSRFPTRLQSWAYALGILATLLASIQYLPQLYTTWRLQHVGSLSIPMMCIQTPGSFVWAGSLAARLGLEGWSSWGTFLVTGCLQGCLLVMGIWFEIRNRRQRKEASDGHATGDDGQEDTAAPSSNEETPLLGNGR